MKTTMVTRGEDDGLAQSMTVPQHASRDDEDDGLAQSMNVPQHASPGDDDGLAQSMTVPQHARRSNAAEMDMEMENLEREMLEAESAEEEIQERLDRNRELQRRIESELVRQRWHADIDREVEEMHAEIDREVEEMRRADEIESHFVRFVEPLVEPTRPQEEVVEEEFEGLAEEVILQFLLSLIHI